VKITVDQTEEDSGFRPVVENMYQTMRQGKTFSEALGLYPALFSPLFVNIVKSGEASGAIDAALTQINAYMGREEAIRRKVATAMAYPAILLCVGIGSLAVLMTVVIPKLKPIFASMKQTLPPITKMIFALSDLSRDGMLTCALLFFAAIYFFYTQRKAAWFLAIGSQIKRSIPMLKDLTAHQEYAHFSRSLGMLVKSRTPVMQALDVARRTVSDPRLAAALVKVHGELAGGSGLAKSLEQNTDLPPFFVKMIAVGEESGRLGDVLDEVTAAYADQVEADIAIMSSLIEPLLILVMGVVLGGVVLSVLIPMFQLTQAVGS
jgi:general secretion pathway protein F